MNRKIKYVYLSILVLLTATIIILSSMSRQTSIAQSDYVTDVIVDVLDNINVPVSQDQADSLSSIVRKFFGHFVLFFVEGIFAFLTLVNFKKFKKRIYHLLIPILFVILIGFTSEGIQLFADGRGASIVDVLINVLGGMLGILFVFLITIKKYSTKELAL